MCAAGLMSFTEHGVYVFRLFVLTFCSLLHFDRSCLVPADFRVQRQIFYPLYFLLTILSIFLSYSPPNNFLITLLSILAPGSICCFSSGLVGHGGSLIDMAPSVQRVANPALAAT